MLTDSSPSTQSIDLFASRVERWDDGAKMVTVRVDTKPAEAIP